MAQLDYQRQAVGQVYAEALLKLAREQNVLEPIKQDLQNLGLILKASPEWLNFLSSQSIGVDQKLALARQALGKQFHPLTLQVIGAMGRRDRLSFLDSLLEAFADLLAKEANLVEVELTTAMELSAALLEKIAASLTKALQGQTPVLRVTLDASLIGGVRLRIGDRLIDASVDTQLTKLSQQLRQGGYQALKMSNILSVS